MSLSRNRLLEATNPYQETDLPNQLREVEMVADKFYNGGVILIRTKDGWRAFFGSFAPNYFESIEKRLDKNTPSYDYINPNFKRPRTHKLTEKIFNLLIDCGESNQGSYYPLKYVDELTKDDDKE